MNERINQIDKLFQQWDTTKSPGCALAVVQNGDVIYKRGYGMATLEHNVIIQPNSVFYIASTSKQFAAFSIALLEEQGILSVEDDVRKYIPELPDYGDPIQIQHLIHHISGLRDYLELNTLSGRHSDELITPEEALNLISRQKQLNFKTGDRFLYCNSGYFLLSVLVERISGKTLRQFAHENIFVPLGMKNTHFHDDRTEPVVNRAVGYRLDKEHGYRIDIPGLETVGSGGIYSTINDLALWDRNFYQNRLGKGDPKMLERILVPGVLNSGEVLEYAFGLTVQEYKGLKKVGHSGGYGGYSAEFIRFPEHSITVICLSNNGTLSAPSMALKVADLILADYFSNQKVAETEKIIPVVLDEEILKEKAGYYLNEEGDVLKFIFKDGELALDFRDMSFSLTPVSPTHFHLFNAPILAEFEFSTEDGKQVVGVDMKRGKKPELLHKIPLRIPLSAELEALTGEYFSDELGSTAIISLNGDELILKLGRHSGSLVVGENGKYIIEGNALSRSILFADASEHPVTRISMNAGRVRDIQFIRK